MKKKTEDKKADINTLKVDKIDASKITAKRKINKIVDYKKTRKELKIPHAAGFCKNCFNLRRPGSAYCGECTNETVRPTLYTSSQLNFPLFNKAKKVFKWGKDFDTKKLIFTYGDTFFCSNDLSPDLVAHEITHYFQQTRIGIKEWWNNYFKDADFRLDQELVAYRNQYEALKASKGEAHAKYKAGLMATTLSGQIYGEIVSYEEALRLILNIKKDNGEQKKED